MGIQGLARRLEPYATRYSSEQLEGYSAVVDGPALAYYAHSLALVASASTARIPSYADVVAAALRWLTSVESGNIKVSAIFFDGALPLSKRAERLSRTEQNNRRVQQLRANYPTISCPVPTYLGSISYAFLAPALQEALQASPFASRTRIVPGEADDWCALHAKDNAQSIIFTSDTDLILYDYRPETLIVFLNDADVTAGINAYSPDHIRKKLQLKSLVPFAYVLRSGPQDTASDLAHNARGVNLDSAEFVDFSRRYIAKIVAPAYISHMSDSLLSLPKLDVRVSEFVQQALEGSERPLVYMPLLVEDPNQASAWNICYHVRTLAYSLLANKKMTVHEYRRKAQGIAVQEIATYLTADVSTTAADLERQVGALIEWATIKPPATELLWLLFALSLVLQELNTPPPVPLVLRILNNDFDNTWPYIQLMARMHAALYSLRILKQIITVWLHLNLIADTKLHTCLSSLSKHMRSFPSLPAIFGVPGQAKLIVVEHEELKGLVEEIYTSVGAQVPVERVSNKKKKRQMREVDRKKRKAEQRQQSTTQVANSYALLDDGQS
ncbi:hypothetical protein BDW02DRAFT_592894 [Decorospora gaudefroyi]|uniref:Asteroid domain-containing protein n=1 Tax=Decorospora gaudefroyi TaxID=184978 RepID=A0A6A5K433_9PLEO|nr:hypothetical protein BDW02DRAFT_592894 [Decorospora gaudefroyi]